MLITATRIVHAEIPKIRRALQKGKQATTAPGVDKQNTNLETDVQPRKQPVENATGKVTMLQYASQKQL